MSISAGVARALALAHTDAAQGYAGQARAVPGGSRRRAVGDPQAPLATFLEILAGHGLLEDSGRLAPDVHLVSMGDHFDWGPRDQRESVARSGLELLAWLAAHPPEQVTLILGNHDLGRVGELAGFDDAAYRTAQAEADAVMAGTGDAARFRERYPRVPTAEVLSRDLATFRTAQQRLVAALLRSRRFCVALGAAPRVLLSHAGVTRDDFSGIGVDAERTPDAVGLAGALNAALDTAVVGWSEGTPLAIPVLHQPGTAASGEGRGIFYHRPGHPSANRLDALGHDLFAGPPRRRFDPRSLPRGLVQAVGHIGDRKCREMLGAWAPPPQGATYGRLRHLRTDGREGSYSLGVPDGWGTDEAVMLFLDGTMAHPDARPYELLDLDTFGVLIPSAARIQDLTPVD